MVYAQVCFHAIVEAWLGCDAGWAGVKSVPIATVFRSKEQNRTNLVRFSEFLVLLSRFVVGGQGIIPARVWIEEEKLGLILGGSAESRQKPNIRCPIPDAQFKKPV
jgi:hypothetical protein